MSFIDDKVLEVLSKLPSECAYIDYKEFPYIKGLFRFAKTLSKIAESFHNDALENIEEGKIYKSKDS